MNKYKEKLIHSVQNKIIPESKRDRNYSYSQLGEDLIIKFIFNQLSIDSPSYLDIGAYHPFKLSNTALLYAMGSRGINIEPNPNNFSLFLQHRKEDINLNFGVSTHSGSITYFEMNASTLNTFSHQNALDAVDQGYEITQERKIDVFTIKEILGKYWNNKFPDLLTIDIEGTDYEVLDKLDESDSLPKVICAETVEFSRKINFRKNEELIKLIVGKGFKVFADTYINTIFIKEGLFHEE